MFKSSVLRLTYYVLGEFFNFAKRQSVNRNRRRSNLPERYPLRGQQ